MTTTMEQQVRELIDREMEFVVWMLGNGYSFPKPIPNGRVAALMQFVYTCAIVTVKIGDKTGYDDRWCYHDRQAAHRALEAWDGTGEPQGWHRHPSTGRRRPDGDASREYINR